MGKVVSRNPKPINVVAEITRMRQARGVSGAEYVRLAVLGAAVSDVMQTATALERVLQVLEKAGDLPATLTQSSAYVLADFRDALMRASAGGG